MNLQRIRLPRYYKPRGPHRRPISLPSSIRLTGHCELTLAQPVEYDPERRIRVQEYSRDGITFMPFAASESGSYVFTTVCLNKPLILYRVRLRYPDQGISSFVATQRVLMAETGNATPSEYLGRDEGCSLLMLLFIAVSEPNGLLSSAS